MANTLGGLVVTLGLNAADYFQGLTKAEYQAKKFASTMQTSMNTVRTAIAGLGVGLIVKEVFDMGKSFIDSAGKLDDLADATGSSVESLSKLDNQARIAGASFDDFENVLLKLSVKLGDTSNQTEGFTAALKNLGVTAKDPATAVQQIIIGLDKYKDSATKAAYAQELFGKAGARFLATLHDMAGLQDVVGTTTTKQAEDAEKLTQAFNRLSVESTRFKNAVLSEIVPALITMLGVMNDAIRVSGSLWEALKTFAQFNPFASTAENLEYFDKEIDKLKKKIETPTFLGFRIGVSDQLKADLVKLEQAREIAIASQLRAVGGAPTNERIAIKRDLPTLPKKGSADDAAANARRLLDQQVKAQEGAIRDEQEILRDRERFLQSYYQDDLISIKAYYDGRKNASDEALRKTLSGYDAEITALLEFRNNPALKEADRIKATTDITEAIRKRGQAEQEANVRAYDSYLDKNRAIQQYTDSVVDLDAQVKLLLGDERAAAEIRFDVQNRRDKARFTVEGNTQALANQEFIKKQALAQVDLNKAAREYALTLDALSVAQGRINLAQESGNITSLEAIRQRSDLAIKTAANLRIQADAQERLARTLVGPEQDQAIAKLAQMRLAIDQLAESANELENTFRRTFENAFTNNLADAIDKTKTWSQAFKAAVNDVSRSITHLASQNIAESLFGKKGPGGGIAGLIASLFGAASGGGSLPAEIFQFGRAIGGPVAANQPYIVGERGPELFVPKVSGNIVPNGNMAGSSRTVIQHINVMPGASRTTANQAAMRSGIELQRAIGRNG